MDHVSVPPALVPQIDAGDPVWTQRDAADSPGSVNATDEEAAEREFIQAIEAYKHASGRMFPTWSEVLEVLTTLGYAKNEAWSVSGEE